MNDLHDYYNGEKVSEVSKKFHKVFITKLSLEKSLIQIRIETENVGLLNIHN